MAIEPMNFFHSEFFHENSRAVIAPHYYPRV